MEINPYKNRQSLQQCLDDFQFQRQVASPQDLDGIQIKSVQRMHHCIQADDLQKINAGEPFLSNQDQNDGLCRCSQAQHQDKCGQHRCLDNPLVARLQTFHIRLDLAQYRETHTPYHRCDIARKEGGEMLRACIITKHQGRETLSDCSLIKIRGQGAQNTADQQFPTKIPHLLETPAGERECRDPFVEKP